MKWDEKFKKGTQLDFGECGRIVSSATPDIPFGFPESRRTIHSLLILRQECVHFLARKIDELMALPEKYKKGKNKF